MWLFAVGIINSSGYFSFISYSGRKISECSGDPFDSRYFFQRVNVLIRRYNSILFRETFPAEDEIDT